MKPDLSAMTEAVRQTARDGFFLFRISVSNCGRVGMARQYMSNVRFKLESPRWSTESPCCIQRRPISFAEKGA